MALSTVLIVLTAYVTASVQFRPQQSAVGDLPGHMVQMGMDAKAPFLARLAADGPPQPPPGQDATFEIDLGTDPDIDMNEVRKRMQASETRFPRLSDAVADAVDSVEIDGVKVMTGAEVPVFDASVSVSGTKLTFVVPGADVQASTNWWQGALITATSWALGLAAGAVCIVAFPAAVAFCGFLEGFLTSFFDNTFTAAVDGDLNDPEKWGDIFSRSLASGLVGAGIGQAAQKLAPELIQKMVSKAKAVGAKVRTWWKFMGDVIASGGDTLAVMNRYLRRLLDGVGSSSGQIRLMPLGDSITYGVGSSDGNGFRDELRGYLSKLFPSVDFVGSVKAGSMGDRENEGHPGARIDEIEPFGTCNAARYQPNVITVHAGTNDMNQNYNLSTAPDRLRALVNKILTESPRAVVLVAQLIPTGKAGLQPRIDAYNAAVARTVQEMINQGKNVVLADMSDVRVSDGLENDAHPTDAGYAKMARAWYDALIVANYVGMLQKPLPQEPSHSCDPTSDPVEPGGTALGPGWRKLGVIAPGMQRPANYDRTEIAEMNGDRRADYVQIRQDGSIRVGINTEDQPGQPTWPAWGGGGGTFSPAGTSDGASFSPYIRFADIDGNGRDDFLVVIGGNDGPFLIDTWLNLPGSGTQPTWKYIPRLRVPMENNAQTSHVRFADVNGDGRDDVLRVSDIGEVHAYFNNSNPGSSTPTWTEKRSWAPGVNGASLANLRFADVNNDNKADYLMVGADGSVHAFLNKGGKDAGGFEKHLNWSNASNYPRQYVQFNDISGDGKADYLVVYQQGAVRAWLNRDGNL